MHIGNILATPTKSPSIRDIHELDRLNLKNSQELEKLDVEPVLETDTGIDDMYGDKNKTPNGFNDDEEDETVGLDNFEKFLNDDNVDINDISSLTVERNSIVE